MDAAAYAPPDPTSHLARLQWITSALSRSLTPGEVANVVIGHAFDALQASTGAAYFVSGDEGIPRYAGSRGVAESDVEAWRSGTRPPRSITWAIESKQPLWLGTRPQILAHFPGFDQWATPSERLQALVALPLLIEGRLLGAIAFSFADEQRFGAQQRDFLTTLADLSAQALDRARLFEAERKARQEAAEANRRWQLLSEASKSFAEASRDLSSALNVIAERLTAMVGDAATIALISLIREDGTMLENVAARAREPEYAEYLAAFAREHPQRVGVGWRGRVAATGEPLFLPVVDQTSLENSAASDAQPLLERFKMATMMVVPLRVRDRILGTVSMSRADPTRPYTRSDLMFVQELADRAALTIENARLYESATRASRVRDHLLFVAGHELLTPLTVLRLQVSSLQRNDFDPARAASKLEMTARSLERLDNLIEKFIDISCISAGQLSFTPEPVDLGGLVRDVAALFGERLEKSGCDLELLARESIVGQWDRLRIEQVITNLFSNACKYGAGSPVEVAVGRSSDMAFVQVKDHGVGMAPEKQALIFQRFERAVADRNMGGLRLGLWICREIVEAHGGRIAVESAPGQGSAFTVYLPISQAPAPPPD
ncbi:MAG TPA: GAF domain-containing sensor histidine kinase [Polyangia bacterium]|nr:GAF domain-containing sensor histidine kinase [Polyangia bacterium]